jgi:CubicO group peptidase (beta-lactamase class C family)
MRIASLASLASLAFLASFTSAVSGQTSATGAWPTATPAEVGLNAAVLDSIDAEIRSGRYGPVDQFTVVRRGRLAFNRRYQQNYDSIYGDSARSARVLMLHDRVGSYNYFNAWWHPWYRRGDLHTLQSVTKTITSIIIGAATMRGQFPSLDTPVLSFFNADSVANVDERKRRMTIRHLLTMTAGFDWDEGRPYADTLNTGTMLEGSYDWVKFTIDRPMSEEPGTRYNYNSGASQILSRIFIRATGIDIEEYAARHVFGPLGIRDWHWKRTPSGVPDTEGGLYLAAPDLAKLWYLFVKDGAWNGSQVVSRDWVRASVAPAMTVNARANVRYGYKWWLYPNPVDSTRTLWGGSGFGGQAPLAVPEDDLVMVVNQWNILPGRPGFPARIALGRILRSMTR